MIYHLVPRAEFERQPAGEPYVAASLAREGFIHLTAEPSKVAWVAKTFYRNVPDLLVLTVNEDRLAAPLRYELTPDGIFPHLFGPLNRDAIVDCQSLRQDSAGNFVFEQPGQRD